jgi:hypothetical protein
MDLEKAGLVHVERRGKRSPIVIILAEETEIHHNASRQVYANSPFSA